MEKQKYFLYKYMDYTCKNKLQLALRDKLITIENTLVDDLEALKAKITQIVEEENAKFPRCTAEKVSFYKPQNHRITGNCGVSSFLMFQIILVKQ